MAIVDRDNHVTEWPPVSWQRWRRLFEVEDGQEWLRVEEFHDGDTLVVRAELPDIDPDKDVEVTSSDGMVRIHAHREQKAEHKEKRGYRSEFRYGEFERTITLPRGGGGRGREGDLHQRCARSSDPLPREGGADLYQGSRDADVNHRYS